MSQPAPYARSFSFTDHEADSPSQIQPGVSLDGEFDSIGLTVTGILSNLAQIQRDDGALRNAIVGLDALAPAVLVALGAASQWAVQGEWATATDYVVSDVVSEGTATYVCGEDHTSAALFATDLAVAGRWVLIFDSAGSVPADNSVETVKIVDGAVTDAKQALTTLDLTGSFRTQGGVAAGTAAKGGLLHAKLAAGDVFGKIERTTDAQGAAGYQIIGVGATWGLQMATSSNNLAVMVGVTVAATFLSGGGIDVPASIRAVAGAVPTTGAGAFLHYAAGIGYLSAFDYDATQWKDLRLRGKDVYLLAGGVEVAKLSSTAANFYKQPQYNGVALGYLGLPQVADNDAYDIALTDNGGHIYSENVAGQTINLPAFADVAFGTDFTTVIINDGSSPITIQGGTAVDMRLVGTATVGNTRTVAAGGWATIKNVKQNRFFVGGVGVS